MTSELASDCPPSYEEALAESVSAFSSFANVQHETEKPATISQAVTDTLSITVQAGLLFLDLTR